MISVKRTTYKMCLFYWPNYYFLPVCHLTSVSPAPLIVDSHCSEMTTEMGLGSSRLHPACSLLHTHLTSRKYICFLVETIRAVSLSGELQQFAQPAC